MSCSQRFDRESGTSAICYSLRLLKYRHFETQQVGPMGYNPGVCTLLGDKRALRGEGIVAANGASVLLILYDKQLVSMALIRSLSASIDITYNYQG